MNGRDIVLTGIPRGGTTLACHLLGLCRNTVALFEPMEVMRLSTDHDAAADAVMAFLAAARSRLLRDGTAPSKQQGGRVPDNSFGDAPGPGGERRLLVAPGLLKVDPRPRSGFTLVVKHNAAFIALLPKLAARAEALAIVRHPLAVLASWNSVELPIRYGRVPAGERLDPALGARLEDQPDSLQRQLTVLDWCFARLTQSLPQDRILRYEDIVASQGETLFERAGLQGIANTPLQERNANPAWRDVDIVALAQCLQTQEGAWRYWYPLDSIPPLAQRMRQAQSVGEPGRA